MARKARSSYSLYKIKGIYYYNIPGKVAGDRRLRGSCGTDIEEEAHAIAQKIVHELKQRNIYGQKPTISLGVAINKYWLQHAVNLKSAQNSIAGHCAELLAYFGKDTFLHEIGTDKLQQFRSWKKNQPVRNIKEKSKSRLISTTTVNRILEVFRSIYFMARDDWRVEVADINFKKVFFPAKDREVHYLTKSEIGRIINFATEKHTKNMILFAFLTGLRWSNISNLKWSDIDMDKRIIINRVKSKKEGGQLLYTEIHDELFEFLLSLPREGAFVFMCAGNQVKSIRRSFKTACKRANITLPKGQSIHIMRHSHITYLLEQGVPVHIVKEAAGHTNINTTMRYTHVVSKVKRNALNSAFRSKNGQMSDFVARMESGE